MTQWHGWVTNEGLLGKSTRWSLTSGANFPKSSHTSTRIQPLIQKHISRKGNVYKSYKSHRISTPLLSLERGGEAPKIFPLTSSPLPLQGATITVRKSHKSDSALGNRGLFVNWLFLPFVTFTSAAGSIHHYFTAICTPKLSPVLLSLQLISLFAHFYYDLIMQRWWGHLTGVSSVLMMMFWLLRQDVKTSSSFLPPPPAASVGNY